MFPVSIESSSGCAVSTVLSRLQKVEMEFTDAQFTGVGGWSVPHIVIGVTLLALFVARIAFRLVYPSAALPDAIRRHDADRPGQGVRTRARAATASRSG